MYATYRRHTKASLNASEACHEAARVVSPFVNFAVCFWFRRLTFILPVAVNLYINSTVVHS